MKSNFSRLMQELSDELDTPLEPDVMNACTILFEDILPVQLELNEHKNTITLAAIIIEIPPGKFREMVLTAGLKANEQFPRYGTFAYRDTTNELILFHDIILEDIDGKKIADYLGIFVDTAMTWRKSIDSGNITSLLPKKKKKSNNDPYKIKH
jgi:hypothetical protein